MFMKLAGATLALATSLLLAGCTLSLEPVFPQTGDRTSLVGNIACDYFDEDGSPGSSSTDHYRVIEVGSKDAYTYYAFKKVKEGEAVPPPAVFSLHKTHPNFYVGQAIDIIGTQYFWYDASKGSFMFYENGMDSIMTAVAKKNSVVLDPFTTQYYVTVHGSQDNIRNYLTEVGDQYKGSSIKCKRE